MPAGYRATVYVPDAVGAEQDVFVRLTSDDDFLAERPMYFDYTGMGAAGWTGGHCVIGSTVQATRWFFAEGYTGAGFQEWMTLQNTGDAAAKVEVAYYPEGGAEPIIKPHTVPPRSRYNIYVNGDAGEGLAISAGLTSDQPIIVERPMYFNYDGEWTGGHDVVGYRP